jgi:hypothetical protein
VLGCSDSGNREFPHASFHCIATLDRVLLGAKNAKRWGAAPHSSVFRMAAVESHARLTHLPSLKPHLRIVAPSKTD